MLHSGLKYGQICDTKDVGQISPSRHPVKQTHWGEIEMKGERKEGRDGQRHKMSNRGREMRKIDKQMSARSHQLGAGILKENV